MAHDSSSFRSFSTCRSWKKINQIHIHHTCARHGSVLCKDVAVALAKGGTDVADYSRYVVMEDDTHQL